MTTHVVIRNAEPNPRADNGLHLEVKGGDGIERIPPGEEVTYTIGQGQEIVIIEYDELAEVRTKDDTDLLAVKEKEATERDKVEKERREKQEKRFAVARGEVTAPVVRPSPPATPNPIPAMPKPEAASPNPPSGTVHGTSTFTPAPSSPVAAKTGAVSSKQV